LVDGATAKVVCSHSYQSASALLRFGGGRKLFSLSQSAAIHQPLRFVWWQVRQCVPIKVQTFKVKDSVGRVALRGRTFRLVLLYHRSHAIHTRHTPYTPLKREFVDRMVSAAEVQSS
jgi:hypothetical protein